MKKLLMGMVWFVVLFVGIWIVLGCIIAARIPLSDYPSVEAYEQACREAGARLGMAYGGYTISLAALLAAIGTVAGVLPGTGPSDRWPKAGHVLKQLLMGTVWFGVLCLGTCMIGGFFVTARIARDDYASQEAYQQACSEAGYKAGVEYRFYVLTLPALLAAMGTIAGVLPGTGGRVAIDEPQSSSDASAEEATVPSRSVQLPPWSVHLLVPGLVLVSGSLGFFRSSSKGTMGLVILAMAVVTGLICSGGLLLYERLSGAIKD